MIKPKLIEITLQNPSIREQLESIRCSYAPKVTLHFASKTHRYHFVRLGNGKAVWQRMKAWPFMSFARGGYIHCGGTKWLREQVE